MSRVYSFLKDGYRQPLFVALLFATIGGIWMLYATHAATTATAIETEQGTVSGGATVVSDSLASGSNAVQFDIAGSSVLNGYGFSSDIQYDTSTQQVASLITWKANHAKWVRFQLKWPSVQYGGPASWDWSSTDTVVNNIVNGGMVPLPIIDDTPTWARMTSCASVEICAPDPAYDGNYKAFVLAAAQRYSGKINNWEVWNEPNNPTFWQPTPDPNRYTALLKLAYSAIHQVQPTALVVSGGLAPGSDSQGGGWISPVTFLKNVYGVAGKGSFDAVGWHPYTWPADPATQDPGLA